MTELPIIDPPTEGRSEWKARVATLIRCLLIVSCALAMRLTTEQRNSDASEDAVPLSVSDLANSVPRVDSLSPPDSDGLQVALDSSNDVQAIVCRTLPWSAGVTGYRGPADVLLVLDSDAVVESAELLSCEDTPEHVAVVRRDAAFFRQFQGWQFGDPATFTDVDATSGATLTALAIAESVALRLEGNRRPGGELMPEEKNSSLKFPRDFSEADLELVLPDRTDVKLGPSDGVSAAVMDAGSGKSIGTLIRTGPLDDSISGYQGPSELLIFTDDAGHVQSVRLRHTFDNQPYAGYLNEDDYFWSVFLQKRIEDLRSLDLAAEQVEGVSGATMTSMAVADTMVAATKKLGKRRQRLTARKHEQQIHWTLHDTGTAIVLLAAIVIGTTRLRGVRWLQTCWLLLLIGYFGLLTGNLVSLAVLFGWASRGIAWRLAPGLAAVMLISLLVPPVSKRNLYCTHICPHGAVQQLLRRLKIPRWKPGRRLRRTLLAVPGITLLAAAIVTLLGYHARLSAWEPFNAWIWHVAGPLAFGVAGLTLLYSAFVPMGWCRYGCATGRLLEYLRHSAKADQITLADGLLLLLTVGAWSLYGLMI